MNLETQEDISQKYLIKVRVGVPITKTPIPAIDWIIANEITKIKLINSENIIKKLTGQFYYTNL